MPEQIETSDIDFETYPRTLTRQRELSILDINEEGSGLSEERQHSSTPQLGSGRPEKERLPNRQKSGPAPGGRRT